MNQLTIFIYHVMCASIFSRTFNSHTQMIFEKNHADMYMYHEIFRRSEIHYVY